MKFVLYAILIIAMCLTVPWFFSAAPSADGSPVDMVAVADGFPTWVVYVVGLSLGYACLVTVLLHYFWDTSADDDGAEPQSEGSGE
jgi:hypothetical protein